MIRSVSTINIPIAVAALLVGGGVATAALTLRVEATPVVAPTGSTFSSEFGRAELSGAVGREIVVLKARRAAEFDACRGPQYPARPC